MLAPRTPTAGSPDSPWPNTPTNTERTASSPYRPGGRGGEVGRGLEGAEERAWFGGVKRTPLDRLRHREQVNLRRDRHGTRCSIASTGVLSLRACRPTTRPGSVSRWSGCRYGSGPGAAEQPPLPERRSEVERALQVAFGLDALGEDVLANDTEYGLGGSVFAADLERARRVPIESTAAWCGSITPGGPGRSLSPTRQPFTGAGELHGAGRLLSPTEQTTRRPGRAGRGGRSPDGALAGPGDR